MSIRKLIYYPSDAQKKVVGADVYYIMTKCADIGAVENKEQKENQKSHDGECPKCKAREDDIVDNICMVQSKGKLSGKIIFGFGEIKDNRMIETVVVNHCNYCNNEWQKFKTKTITQVGILIVALKYLGDILEDPEKTKKQYWKQKTIEVFNGRSPEAILSLVKKYESNLHKNTVNQLTLRILRKKYESIFNLK